MIEVNWVTVIISVIFSSFTATFVAYNVFCRLVAKLEKLEADYLEEIKTITIETIRKHGL
ncbi:hypothetical protein ABET51_02820 [Metabacillus fastidiosus]|uniref:hypothetical protein n=1 Tax=Metabacillus fastidiosus TaxID=1458 RepID=UPI003D2BF098